MAKLKTERMSRVREETKNEKKKHEQTNGYEEKKKKHNVREMNTKRKGSNRPKYKMIRREREK